MKKRLIAPAAVVVAAAAAGWTANDILMGQRLVIFDADGNARIVATVDATDQAYISVLDRDGTEVDRLDGTTAAPSSIAGGTSPAVAAQLPPARTGNATAGGVAEVIEIRFIPEDTKARDRADELERAAATARIAARDLVQKARSATRVFDQNNFHRSAAQAEARARSQSREAAQIRRDGFEAYHIVDVFFDSRKVSLRISSANRKLLEMVSLGEFIEWEGSIRSANKDGTVYDVDAMWPGLRPNGWTRPGG